MKAIRRALIEDLIGFSVRHARGVVLVTFAATVVLAWFALKVRINPDFYSLLPRNDAIVKQLQEYGGSIVPADVLVLAATASPGGDILSGEPLAAYADAVQAVGALPEVVSTISPFNFVSFSREQGHRAIHFMSPGGGAPVDTAAFRTRLTDSRYAKDLVLSKDGTMLISYFEVKSLGAFGVFMEEVNGILAPLRPRGLVFFMTGSVPASVQTGFYLSRDLSRLLVLAALVIVLCYAAGFRRLRGLVFPFISVILGTIWTVGFMGVAGYALSLISVVAPPLILIFGNEYNIFTTSEYLRLAQSEGASPGWIERASRNVSKPILMAFLTTAVGFLSLYVTDIRQTREFAIAATVGSLACAFLALFFLPALYSLLHAPRPLKSTGEGFNEVMRAVARFTVRFPVLIVAALAVAVAAFALTWPRLSFNTDSGSYYPRNDWTIRDTYAIYAKAGGYEQLSVSFDAPGGKAGYFLDPAVLAQVQQVETALRDNPDVTYSLSLPGLLREINRAATGKDELPSNRAILSVYSRLLTSSGSTGGLSALGSLANKDFSRLTLTFRIYNSQTGRQVDEARIRSILASMESTLAAHPIGAKPVVWGDLIRILSFADSLRRSLFISMGISIASILLLTILVFRSLLYGLFSLVPLGTGLLLNFAFMAVTRIPLDLTTIMVANIGIGVGVDSAIYLVIQYRRELARSPEDYAAAIQRTLMVMGPPILLASLSMAAGLLTFMTAAFRPVMYFGMLVTFTLLVTMGGTLVTLPALLVLRTRPRLRSARHGREAGA